MRKSGMLSLWAAILVFIFLLSGCSSFVQKFDNAALHQDAETMLNALIRDDFDAAYSMVSEVYSEEEFASAFDQMRHLVSGTDLYTLELLSISTNTNITNGDKVSVARAVYNMRSNLGSIIVSIGTNSNLGLTNFHLVPFEQTDYYFTGTIGTMKEAGTGQWILLLMNLPVIGFSVFALVDCCRRKFRNKTMWILLIIFGFVTLGITISDIGFRTNFNIGWITACSALIRYGSGAFMIRLMVPAGSIAYFIARRSLLKAPVSDISTEESASPAPPQ